MTLRQHILDIIGQEHSHLRGEALLERYYFDGYNNGYESGKSFKENFYFGFHTKATVPMEAICQQLLPLLGNFPEDQKFKFEYGIKRAGDGIIRHVPLAERISKEYERPAEDEVVKECYFKLEGYYKK